MLNQKKVEIFLRKFRKSPAKQFSEIAYNKRGDETQHIVSSPREGFIT